jgi:hypothetical protein
MQTCFEIVTTANKRWQRIIDGYVPVSSGMIVNIVNSKELDLHFHIDVVSFDMKTQTVHASDTEEFEQCYINKHRQTLLNEGWTEISP